MAARVVEEIRVGERRIAGTTFPAFDQVERQESSGRVRWVVLRWVCNGTADSSRPYKTREKALTALHRRELVRVVERGE